jgi:uncharacterized protein
MNLVARLQYNVILALVVWCGWLFIGEGYHALSYIEENWRISIVMIFGSMVAGGTSEGGGAVAFPFFTKVFHIDPHTAKLFALCIQSVGMTTASLLIIVTRVKVDWFVIRWATISGALGMWFGAFYVTSLLPSDVTKMTFTMMEASFAVALILLNRRDQNRHIEVPERGWRERQYLMFMGFIGGMFGSVVGVGIDIVVFSMMVLLFRVSEKVATPTSVILMAINAMAGVSVFGGLLGQVDHRIFSYWMAAVPVVVIGAPIGAIACAYMSRSVIVKILIALIFIEVASSLFIISLNSNVVIASLMTLTVCSSMFYQMYRSQRYDPRKWARPNRRELLRSSPLERLA